MSDPKTTLRQSVARDVAKLSAKERDLKSAQILARLFAHPLFVQAKSILAYDSTGGEVSTQELLARCVADSQCDLALPRMDKKPRQLSVHTISSLDDLESTRFGFREPPLSWPLLAVESLDLVIVPGVAFDINGARLGKGGGYYDRFLAQKELKAARIAIAFECQIVPALPTLPHDQGVDVIITEDRIIGVRTRA